MDFSIIRLTILTTFMGLGSSAALPQRIPLPIPAFHGKGYDSAEQQALHQFSTLFGQQLAGAMQGGGNTSVACSSVGQTTKWGDLGLNITAVEGPVCETGDAPINATSSYTDSIMSRSDIFTTQLLNSFNGSTRFKRVCDSLSLDRIDFFPMIGSMVKESVCRHSGKQMAPQPFGSPPNPNEAALTAATNTESTLFGLLLASGFDSWFDLKSACAYAPQYMENLEDEHLNGTAVVDTLCSIDTPISADTAKGMLKSWMTRYYVTVLENISDVGGWKKWLCDNMDVAKMDAVGLDGVGAQHQICSDVGPIN